MFHHPPQTTPLTLLSGMRDIYANTRTALLLQIAEALELRFIIAMNLLQVTMSPHCNRVD